MAVTVLVMLPIENLLFARTDWLVEVSAVFVAFCQLPHPGTLIAATTGGHAGLARDIDYLREALLTSGLNEPDGFEFDRADRADPHPATSMTSSAAARADPEPEAPR